MPSELKKVDAFEIKEILEEFKMMTDSFTCIRWGIDDCIKSGVDPEIISNALYLFEKNMEQLHERLSKKLNKTVKSECYSEIIEKTISECSISEEVKNGPFK